MNFSAWSIRNPIAPILAFAMLLVLGWQAFTAMPITRFPNIDVPLVAVTVTQSGAAPAEMEAQGYRWRVADRRGIPHGSAHRQGRAGCEGRD